jgi:predicted transcriptional regulator
MHEEQFKILKVMSEVTSRMDMNEFAHKTGLTPTQTVEYMQQLAKEGYLRKVGGGYTITEKGKTALKAVAPLPENMRFQFYVALNHSTALSAGNVKEFSEAVASVDAVSLEFHVGRGDFETWFKEAVKDPAFAAELAKIAKTELKDEELRQALLKALQLRYSL